MATRTVLRRELARRTGQPFFRRLGVANGTASGNGTTTTLIDTARLKEEDHYWRGQFIYLPATDEVREISAFTNSSSTVTWLAPIASSTTTSQVYEIWSQFVPTEVHDALNHALSTAWPYFFQYGNDESLVIKEDAGLIYTLPTTNTIRRLCQVFLLAYEAEYSGTVTTQGTTTQVIDSSASFVTADVGKYIAVYKDAGAALGEVRQISARDSATQVTVSSAFSAALPVGAKFKKLDKNNPYPQQVMLHNWLPDKLDFPTTIWLGGHPAGYEGSLLKLVYEYEFPTLSQETSTTTCPVEYLYNAALSYLYLQKLATAPATEVPAWEALHRAAVGAAQLYAKSNQFQHLAGTILQHNLNVSGLPADYPF